MSQLLLAGIALLGLAAVAVALLELLVKRADLGVGLVLFAMLLQALFVERVPSLYLGSARVELSDVVFVLVLGAAVARLLRVRSFTPSLRWLLLLGVALLLSLGRGMLTIGAQPAINDVRQYLEFVGPALYIAAFRPSPALYDRLGRLWLAAAAGMLLLVTLRWLAVFAGVRLGVPAEQFGDDTAIRVIDGPYAFFLATAAVLTLPAWQLRGRRAGRLRAYSLLLLLFVMLLDRRTVWAAMVVGVVVLMLRNRRFGKKALGMLAAAAVVTAWVFVAFPTGASGQEPLARSATSSGTLTWRVIGWQELVSSWSENPANWLVGEPFGGGFQRQVEGSEVQAHPHNFYIETMLRTGVIGLAALLALSVGLLRALWRTGGRAGVGWRGHGLFGPEVLPALVAMQIVWFITWVPGSEQGVVTGLALAVVAAHARARRARPGRVAVRAAAPVPTAAPLPTAAPAGGAIEPSGGERA